MRDKFKGNWVDELVAFVDPEAGMRRIQARLGLDVINRYAGASRSKRGLKSYNPKGHDADGDILQDLPTLRERSRDLMQNVPLAKGAIDTKVTNIVGPGLRLHSCIDREYLGLSDEQADKWEQNAEREFRLWAESPDCDIERTCTFSDLQALALRSTFENGDCFALLPFKKRIGSPYGLKVQLIEADRVSNPRNRANTLDCAGGVQKDADGAPMGYWVSNFHPGSNVAIKKREWTQKNAFITVLPTLERRNVLHIYPKLRIGQSRGVPDLAPVVQHLKQLGDYTESELMAAVVSSFFTVFVKSETGASLAPMMPEGKAGSGQNDDYKMGPAAMLRLAKGEDVVFADPNRPNPQFDPFVMAILRQVGVALGLPYELLIKHFTASYSAARAAFIEAWKTFSTNRIWLANHFCQPIYEAFLMEAVASGRLQAPGFLTDAAIRKAYCGATWVGPAKGQIDELKEAKASDMRVETGTSSLAIEAAANGQDWEALHRQRAKEKRMRIEAGLEPDPKLKQDLTPEEVNSDAP